MNVSEMIDLDLGYAPPFSPVWDPVLVAARVASCTRDGVSLHRGVGRARPVPRTSFELLRWSEALAGIARTGLGFTQSLYERERFEEVLKVAADIRAAAEETSRSGRGGHFVEEWLDTVGEGVPGYVTPKVAVGAVVGNDEGRSCSCSAPTRASGCTRPAGPTSATRPSEVAVKEVLEETGIECEPCAAHRRARRPAPRLHPGAALLAGVPLPGHRWRAEGAIRSRPPDVGWFSPDDAAVARSPALDAGGPRRSRRSAASSVDVLFDPPRAPIGAATTARLSREQLCEQRVDDRHAAVGRLPRVADAFVVDEPAASGARPSASVTAAASVAGSISSP